jgi:CRP-like cAMP-binding protein
LILSSNADTRALVAKLDRVLALADEERSALAHLPLQIVALRADQDIVREGDMPSRTCILVEGHACTYSTTGGGRRQIMAFHIPGDMPCLQSLHLRRMDSCVGTLTPCRVAFVQHDALRELGHRHPRIAQALSREMLVGAAIFRRWIMRLGRSNARTRMAHLFCEMVVRMRAAGLTLDRTCPLPITQSELADALGLSGVHVNRTLQELRAARLIVLDDGVLDVRDWEGLSEAGDFDVGYLHLVRPEAA